MPLHDWTRTTDGVFHHFRVQWLHSLGHVLNRGLLPKGYYALMRQSEPGLFGRRRGTLQVYEAATSRLTAVVEVAARRGPSLHRDVARATPKAAELLRRGIGVLHLDVRRCRMLVSHELGATIPATVCIVRVGQALPEMPLLLAPGVPVLIPLEQTYLEAWDDVPEVIREGIVRPNPMEIP